MNITPPDDTPLQPHTPPSGAPDAQAAADVIRDKLDRIYEAEPAAGSELQEANAVQHRSKHQQFMHELSTSGKDLATIQTEWHNYYQSLPPHEQHVVWQEFYDSQSALTKQPVIASSPAITSPHVISEHKHEASTPKAAAPKLRDVRSKKQVQDAIRHKVTAGGKLKTKHHLQSLFFGLGLGLVVVIIFLFGFFNEVIIAPFIQPSRVASATPLIVGTGSESGVAATANPEIIIPKINIEIPVNYEETSTDEATIEKNLEGGVVHYPTTALPGEVGNTALFGHSSSNIFNNGKYKFAFVLLHTLVPGDTFYLTYQSKIYVYKIITKTVVDPSNVGVLNPVAGQTSTATLITCDPPGTSLRRLVIVGQQISPDPSGNSQSTTLASSTTEAPESLPGNGPTLFSRLMSTTLGKASAIVIILLAFVATIRWVNKPRRHLK